MDRLRGNTFLLLLLRAGSSTLLNPQEYGESKSGITRPNMLADLIRLTNPSYQPAKPDTLKSYFSKYLSGSRINSPSYLPFNDPAYRYGLQNRIGNNYPEVLREMNTFCKSYLSDDNFTLRLLVAGLIDAILEDDSFTGEFNTGDKIVTKDDLGKKTDFMLQPFLLSVWNIILANFPDATDGAETYLAWTKDAGYNTPRQITTQIGAERVKKIAVSSDLPKEMLEQIVSKENTKIEEDEDKIKKAPADEAEADVIEADTIIFDENQAQHEKEQTLINNGRIYHQEAKTIYNIEHIDVFNG